MKKRLISASILIVYSAILIDVMVFKNLPLIRIGRLMFNFGGTQTGPANLIPFKTILPYLLGEKGLLIAGINLLGNIVLLVPIGFLFPFVYQNMTWKKTLTLAVAAGLAIEGMQALFRVGIFDIDDVILNGLGVVVGYWMFTFLANRMPSKKSKNIIVIATTVTAMAVASLIYRVAVHPDNRLPGNFRPVAEKAQSGRSDTGKFSIIQNDDPCKGTGGTGQIVGVENHNMTIQRRDGIHEIIHLTGQTSIRTSTGPASESDLKIGNRVTVVVESNHTATAVLICNGSGAGPAN